MKLNQQQHEILEQIARTVVINKGINSNDTTYIDFTVLDAKHTGEIKKNTFHQRLEQEPDREYMVFPIDIIINSKIDCEVRMQRDDDLKKLEEMCLIKYNKVTLGLVWRNDYGITKLGWKYVNDNMNLSGLKRVVYLKGSDKQKKYGYIIRKKLLTYIGIATEKILDNHLEGWIDNPDKINFDSKKIDEQIKYINYATDMINSIPDAKFFIENLYILGNKKASTKDKILAIEECCKKHANENCWKIVNKLCKYLRERYDYLFN